MSVVRRFTVLPTILGFEVIDADGRPVDTRETRASANGVAQSLNEAEKAGQAALIGALNIGVRSIFRG